VLRTLPEIAPFKNQFRADLQHPSLIKSTRTRSHPDFDVHLCAADPTILDELSATLTLPDYGRVARDSGTIAECQDWPSLGHPGLVWLFEALMPDQTILW
jgi:hypothetical protein